jgi:hypothetical protein
MPGGAAVLPVGNWKYNYQYGVQDDLGPVRTKVEPFLDNDSAYMQHIS